MNRFIQGFALACQFLLALWLGVTFTWWLGIALVIAFLFALIGLQFYLSRQMAGSLPSQTLHLSTLQVWRASCQETINCFRTFYFNQIFRVNTRWRDPLATRESANSKKPPILFLHGFFCNRGLWIDFTDELIDQGHWCEGVSMEPAFGSINEYPKAIDQAIDKLLAKSGAKQVVLVGHSMGGLAARSYLREFGSSKIAKVITLGTPHQGTWLARLGHGANTQQMAISSQWLAELAEHEAQANTGHLLTTVSTWYDNIVFPQGGQTIPGAKHISVTGMGHISMVFSQEIKDLVRLEVNALH